MENEYQTKQSPEQTKKMLWVLWGALIFSMFLYGGIGIFVRSQNGELPKEASYTVMIIPLFIIALLETAFITTLWSKIIKPSSGELRAFLTQFILRMALSESIGLLGLVIYILGAPIEFLIGFLGWGLLLQLSLAPTENAILDFQKKFSPR